MAASMEAEPPRSAGGRTVGDALDVAPPDIERELLQFRVAGSLEPIRQRPWCEPQVPTQTHRQALEKLDRLRGQDLNLRPSGYERECRRERAFVLLAQASRMFRTGGHRRPFAPVGVRRVDNVLTRRDPQSHRRQPFGVGLETSGRG